MQPQDKKPSQVSLVLPGQGSPQLDEVRIVKDIKNSYTDEKTKARGQKWIAKGFPANKLWSQD